jgi:chromate transport protein ChrA
MMEDEVVRRRRWMTHHEFLDFLGATNLIPGPNSTELARSITGPFLESLGASAFGGRTHCRGSCLVNHQS